MVVAHVVFIDDNATRYVLMHDVCLVIMCECFCQLLSYFMTRNHWVWYIDVCGRLSFKKRHVYFL